MKKIMTATVLMTFLAVSCSESEFAQTAEKKKDEPVRTKGKTADVVGEPEELIESENPYRPALQIGQDIDVIGGVVEEPNSVNTEGGNTSVTPPPIDEGNGSTVALEVYFIDPAGANKPAAITVTNSETFKFGWNSTKTDSCKVYVKKKTDAGLGEEKPVNGAKSGTINQARIIVTHTFTASCSFKTAAGADDKIEKSLDANVEGGWFNALKVECPAFCSGLGKRNVQSPDGFACTSGEERPWSTIGVVNFVTGCWHSCAAPEGMSGAASVGGRCYHPTQKRDNDSTDWTVGCYCKT